jgi:hypothetical protein
LFQPVFGDGATYYCLAEGALPLCVSGESIVPVYYTDGTSGLDENISGNDVFASVSRTLSPTPEPGTAVLWFTGIGLMIVMRKRIAHLLLDTGMHGSL